MKHETERYDHPRLTPLKRSRKLLTSVLERVGLGASILTEEIPHNELVQRAIILAYNQPISFNKGETSIKSELPKDVEEVLQESLIPLWGKVSKLYDFVLSEVPPRDYEKNPIVKSHDETFIRPSKFSHNVNGLVINGEYDGDTMGRFVSIHSKDHLSSHINIGKQIIDGRSEYSLFHDLAEPGVSDISLNQLDEDTLTFAAFTIIGGFSKVTNAGRALTRLETANNVIDQYIGLAGLEIDVDQE